MSHSSISIYENGVLLTNATGFQSPLNPQDSVAVFDAASNVYYVITMQDWYIPAVKNNGNGTTGPAWEGNNVITFFKCEKTSCVGKPLYIGVLPITAHCGNQYRPPCAVNIIDLSC